MNAVPMKKEKDAPAANQSGGPVSAVDGTAEATGSLTPEIVIALCGPIGSPLHAAANQIENCLRGFGYLAEKIRLSNLIRINAGIVGMVIDQESRFNEIKSLIETGDALRDKYGEDILAKLAIAKIGADRVKKFGEFEDAAREAETPARKRIRNQRICHVIDSIKNKSELELLRLIYGDALFAIGVFSPLEIRKLNLQHTGLKEEEQIERLVDMDSGEEFSHGQSVRDTFPRCDFFMRVDGPTFAPDEDKAVGQLVEKLLRFFSLIFQTSVVTPTPDETAMYAAASAARNSACLSRQVGAAVASDRGEVLAVGWNDVPRAGGGLYGKPPLDGETLRVKLTADVRCFAKPGRECQNDIEKKTLATKIVGLLADAGYLDKVNEKQAAEAIFAATGIKDLIEFSRAVHAEMHAILSASRVAGDRILGGRIYVTTYPCHSCARHIIASGISQVVYIEPYRKSLATRLHDDAISESAEENGTVRLLQFDGVAPRRFIDLFEAGSRKKNGVLTLAGKIEALPTTHVSLRAIPRLEEVVVAEVESKKLRLPELVQEGEEK